MSRKRKEIPSSELPTPKSRKKETKLPKSAVRKATSTDEDDIEAVTMKSYKRDQKSTEHFFYARYSSTDYYDILVLRTKLNTSLIPHLDFFKYRKSSSLFALISRASTDKTWIPDEIAGACFTGLAKKVTGEQLVQASTMLSATLTHLNLSIVDLADNPGLLTNILKAAPKVSHVEFEMAELYSVQDWLQIIPPLMEEASSISSLKSITIKAPQEPDPSDQNYSLYQAILQSTKNGSPPGSNKINPRELSQWLQKQGKSAPSTDTAPTLSSSSSSSAPSAPIATASTSQSSSSSSSSQAVGTPFWQQTQQQGQTTPQASSTHNEENPSPRM